MIYLCARWELRDYKQTCNVFNTYCKWCDAVVLFVCRLDNYAFYQGLQNRWYSIYKILLETWRTGDRGLCLTHTNKTKIYTVLPSFKWQPWVIREVSNRRCQFSTCPCGTLVFKSINKCHSIVKFGGPSPSPKNKQDFTLCQFNSIRLGWEGNHTTVTYTRTHKLQAETF